ncbi:uncharacterized protein DEA37_0008423 [Paragonimus westermani]|uniref:Uncharacterized protein n=1 Tax=Paragonimus westermani TaxID=34504 RepID=A0A5J4NR79_9TREM|nr:uncharacterized protein DEA37_0008423 [Paragonimus westermani]
MTPASAMGATEETPDMTFSEMTRNRYARAVSTPRRQLRSELWHLHGHTLLFDKHTSPFSAQTSQIMLPSTEQPNRHIPQSQVPFTVFDELSDEVLERGGGGTGDAGTFTSSTPPQTASFSPPSEFSGHSLVHDMKSSDNYPECMFALDLRVPTKRCPEEANMIKRNDPRLKYVNDGAAIRNPFVVDRKVQLAHLTTLLYMLSHMLREHPNWSGLPRLRRQLLRQEERRRRLGEQTNSSGLQSTPSYTSRANGRFESSLTSLDGVGTTLSVEPSGRADSTFSDLNDSKEEAKQFVVSANSRIVREFSPTNA